jgi:hypothetical protein
MSCNDFDFYGVKVFVTFVFLKKNLPSLTQTVGGRGGEYKESAKMSTGGEVVVGEKVRP